MQRLMTPIFITLLVSGCSTVGKADFARLEREIAQAQYTADQAMRYAASAEMKVNEAIEQMQASQGAGNDAAVVPQSDSEAQPQPPSQPPSQAQAIAEQALKIANEAKAAAEKANQRAERMYNKAIGR